jgi:hypothetical protein
VKRLLIALALVAGSAFAPGALAPASAATNGVCQSKAGVTVVVDFSAFSVGVQAVCVTSATSSTTGLKALQDAGFTPTGTNTDGLAFICRINGKPADPPEDCQNTPPSTAYWTYWQATNGGSWVYSSLGATSSHIHVGGFEGWAFHSAAQDGNKTKSPAFTPTRPTLQVGPAASTTTHRSSTSSKSSTSKTTATKGSPTSTSTSASGTATPLTSSTSADSAGGALPGDPPEPGRSPWPFVVAAAGIGAILSGAYVMVLRRRGGGGL